MAAQPVGYDFLATTLATGAFTVDHPARVGPVTRITQQSDSLLVPAAVAPGTNDPLAHLLFALKHESMNLQASVIALKKIAPADLAAAFTRMPSSRYVRLAC